MTGLVVEGNFSKLPSDDQALIHKSSEQTTNKYKSKHS